jgi:hypothetical protein
MKLIQLSRLFLLGLASVALTWLVVGSQATHAQSEPPPTTVTPAPTGEAPAGEVIDLSVDEDHDGMPDQLQAALAEFEAAVATALENGEEALLNDPEALAALEQATEALLSRMPYSEQTRAAQVRIAEIHAAVIEEPDPEVRAELLAALPALEAQMQEDPNFALIDHLMSRRVLDGLNAKAEEGKGDPRNGEATPVPATPVVTATPQPATPAASAAISDGQETAVLVDPAVAASDATRMAAPDQGGLSSYLPVSWTRVLFRDPCSSTQAPNFGVLLRGDLILYSGDNRVNNFFYAKKFSHVGIYDGSANGFQWVYEANPSDGVNLRRLDLNWQETGSCIALSYVGTSPSNRTGVLDWAKQQYGANGATPYNYVFWDKSINTALYCSQLVWKAYKHIDLELDSNHVDYLGWMTLHYSLFPVGGLAGAALAIAMVAPDEIARHSLVNIYNEGQNP